MAGSEGHAPNGIELTKPLTLFLSVMPHEIDWNAHTFSIMNFDLFQSLWGTVGPVCSRLFFPENFTSSFQIGSGKGSRTHSSPGYEPSMQPMHRPAILKLLKHSHECNAFALDPRFSHEFPPRVDLRTRFSRWGTQVFPTENRSVVKVQVVAGKAQALFRATHTVYHIYPASVKGGLEKFFHFLESGHGDGTRTRISRIKSPLQNQFCYTVLKS